MTTIANEVEAVRNSRKDVKTNLPYSPSWVDRLTDWIEGLPGPSWVAYVIFLFLFGLQSQLAEWLFGNLPWGEFDPY